MVLTWKQYKTLKDSLNSGVDEFTALGMIGASEIPIIGPILIAAAGGLLKWGLNYIVNNLVPHEFEPTVESDPEWIDRLERGEGVPLSPDVDPQSWTKEGRMRWQSPENRKKWEELVNKTKNEDLLKNILIPPLIPVQQPTNNNNYRYLHLPINFEVYDDFKPHFLDHPYSRNQGNAIYPGAPDGKFKRDNGKIRTLNDLIRNKKYSNNIYKDVKIKGN